MAAKEKKRPRLRDAPATRKRILAAAKKEFAQNGFSGARVDVIAERGKVNKRMIYHYFESKDALFRHVLECVYTDMYEAAPSAELDSMEPRDALEALIRFMWNYYLDNPEFLTLVNNENLHKARHLQGSDVLGQLRQKVLTTITTLLDRGAAAGVFRPGIDPLLVLMTIAALCSFHMTNRFTISAAIQRDLMSAPALDERLRFNIDAIMRMVCSQPPAHSSY